MAILQTARAKQLGLRLTEAKSWGLNRAIFYAAAKRGFKWKIISQDRSSEEISKKPVERRRAAYFLGNEMAYGSRKTGKFHFTIGEALQTETDYQRQVIMRFGVIYSKAWKEALEIVRQYPRDILLSQNRFFREVYKPRRDELAVKWTKMTEGLTEFRS
jgi:hypothetical protein